MTHPQAILVLPHLRIQNANAIASPLTHGFPSITAFTGLMWALERKLTQVGVPVRLHGVGVICHDHQEQVCGQGRLYAPFEFNLAKAGVRTKDQARKLEEGTPPSIVEEGRMHLQITLVLAVSEKLVPDAQATLVQGNEAQQAHWARIAGDTLAGMRVAGGSVLPSRSVPGKRVLPWMAIVPEDPEAAANAFRQWRRQWLPGFALVGRDDLLTKRLQYLRTSQSDATLLDAWLHAGRFNYEPVVPDDGTPLPEGKVKWEDPKRKKGSGWVVPIPIGYAAITPQDDVAGPVLNARDATVPLRFVESVYSLGEWISPHRLTCLSQLLWHAETDEVQGLYRCRNGYQAPRADGTSIEANSSSGMLDEWDDDEAYDYT